MGFLTGSYLKIMSAKMRLQLQSQLTSIQMQMQRATKQIGIMEKRLNSEQRNSELAMRSQMQSSIWGQNGYASRLAKETGVSINSQDPGSLFRADPSIMQGFSVFQQEQQMRLAQAQSVWGDYFEDYREAQLEPLKNLETNLATQKANIEARLELNKGTEESADKMQKSSQKDFVPDYTGGGQG